jgi:hypothetical protein
LSAATKKFFNASSSSSSCNYQKADESVGPPWLIKKSDTCILHNFCATRELKKKHNTHTHENTRESKQKQKHTLVGIVSRNCQCWLLPVYQLRLIPLVGPCKSFATTKRQPQQQLRVFVVVVVCWLNFMARHKQQAYQQQQQQVLLLLLLFFLNPSSSSSSHNLELASNNYPKLCKEIEQQQRVREANCRSPEKD